MDPYDVNEQLSALDADDSPDTESIAVDTLGCCSLFMQCSDARECLRAENPFYDGCLYRRHLEAGRIFYGKNKNFTNLAPVTNYIAQNSEKSWASLSEPQRKLLLWAKNVMTEELLAKSEASDVLRYSVDRQMVWAEERKCFRVLLTVKIQYFYDVFGFFFSDRYDRKKRQAFDKHYVLIPPAGEHLLSTLPARISVSNRAKDPDFQKKALLKGEADIEHFREMVRVSFCDAHDRYHRLSEMEKDQGRPRINGLCVFPDALDRQASPIERIGNMDPRSTWDAWTDALRQHADQMKRNSDSARRECFTVKSVDLSIPEIVFHGGHGTYKANLEGCTCRDFVINGKRERPCKHMYRLAIELGLTDGPSLPFIDHDPTMDLPPAPPAFPVKELERKIASATQDERTFFCDFLREHQYRKKPEQVFLSSETPYKYFVDNGLLEIVWSRRMLLPATREELKDILSAHGVSFKKNDSKPVLQGLCEELPPPVFEALSADYVSLRLSPRFRKGIRRIYSALLAEDKELYPEKHINYWIIDEEDGSGGE